MEVLRNLFKSLSWLMLRMAIKLEVQLPEQLIFVHTYLSPLAVSIHGQLYHTFKSHTKALDLLASSFGPSVRFDSCDPHSSSQMILAVA